jgi:RHS repeat-associated protein
MKQGSEYYFYQTDHLGTAQKMTAVNGAVIWSAKYSSFGEADVGPSSTITNDLRFGGQQYDRETGIHYNHFRYYDPKTGRYFTQDPLKLGNILIVKQRFSGTLSAHLIYKFMLASPQVLNVYQYVKNNPLKAIDPNGLMSKIPGWLIKQAEKQIRDQIAGKAVDEISGNPEIDYPPEQQQMDKDTDGDGQSDYFDEDDDNDGMPDKFDDSPLTPYQPIDRDTPYQTDWWINSKKTCEDYSNS